MEDELLELALSMYANEPCRICGKNISLDDVMDGAVFVGYSADNKSRSAHRACFENAKSIFEENYVLVEIGK